MFDDFDFDDLLSALSSVCQLHLSLPYIVMDLPVYL